MYIESSLPCVEFFTTLTGVSLKEMREIKEEREMLAKGYVWSWSGKQILKWKCLLTYIQWEKFCCQLQIQLSCKGILEP